MLSVTKVTDVMKYLVEAMLAPPQHEENFPVAFLLLHNTTKQRRLFPLSIQRNRTVQPNKIKYLA